MSLEALWQVTSKAAQSAAAGADQPLRHLERNIATSLRTVADDQDRLSRLLWRLAENAIGTPFTSLPRTWARAASTHRELLVLARTMEAATATTTPLLTSDGALAIEGLQRPDGTVLLTPTRP